MDDSFYFQVSPASGIPIYRQLIDQVLARISSGRLEAGTLLPSVRRVAKELEINPMTVSKAYSLLEKDGVLELIRGQGMRVAERLPRGTIEERRQELVPLLEQVVARAFHLALDRKDILAVLEPLLEDLAGE